MESSAARIAALFGAALSLSYLPSALAAESSPPAAPMTLSDAYASALHRSETVGVQAELLVQASELESQAKAALLPTIGGSIGLLHQPAPASSTGVAISPSDQSTIKVTADQPLFRGFREFAAVRQRNAAISAQDFAVQAAARQLFYDVSLAYYNVLGYAADHVNYVNEIKFNRQRLGELNQFLKIGRARESEMLTFQSNISALEAQLERTDGQLEIAKEVLAFLTGRDRDTPLDDREPEPTDPARLDDELARIGERPEVKQAMANLDVNRESIPIARGGHLPSVDLLGEYYFDRPGSLSSVNWDVQLAVAIPIFQGGAVQSQVRQAESTARQSELLLSQTRRSAEQEIRTFHDSLVSDRRQLDKLAATVDWSKRNYEAERRDYRNGLVTNLEVLTALTTFQDAQRGLDRQRVAVKLDAVRLQAATARRADLPTSATSVAGAGREQASLSGGMRR